MRRFVLALILFFTGLLASSCRQKTPHLVETDTRLEYVHNGTTLWHFHHDPAEGKPYFHPLATSEGLVLTDLRPEDHPWHRALWFSWKYINGVNYWEENRETGKSDGLTILEQVEHSVEPGGDVSIRMELSYSPASNWDKRVMREERRIQVAPPDGSGTYKMDWSSLFTALDEAVVLDRTSIPGEPNGKGWGGYAGYSVRLNQGMVGGSFFNSEGQSNSDANRQPARWMAFNTPGNDGSLLILDHPENIRHPVVWYLVEDMPYFSPAVVHDRPHTIEAGTSLQLRYRLIVSSHSLDSIQAEKEWGNWIR